MVSDPIFRLGGRRLGHGTEPQFSVRTASESVPAYGGAKATRVAEDGYGVDGLRGYFLLGARGPSEGAAGVSRFGLMLSGLPFGFAVVRRGFHLELFGWRYCRSLGLWGTWALAVFMFPLCPSQTD